MNQEKRVLCAAKALIIKNGTFLAIKQRVGEKVFWDLPGGKIEHGETPEETLHREVMEEMGIKAHIISLIGTFSFMREKDGHQVVCITYLCEPETEEIDLTKNPGEDDITEYRWLSKEEFLTGDFPVSGMTTLKEIIRSWQP